MLITWPCGQRDPAVASDAQHGKRGKQTLSFSLASDSPLLVAWRECQPSTLTSCSHPLQLCGSRLAACDLAMSSASSWNAAESFLPSASGVLLNLETSDDDDLAASLSLAHSHPLVQVESHTCRCQGCEQCIDELLIVNEESYFFLFVTQIREKCFAFY